MREHRGETELMRDSGKEDVRAHSWAKAGQLVMEEGRSGGLGKKGNSIRGVHAAARGLPAGREWAGTGERKDLARDAQPGKGIGVTEHGWGRGKQRAGKHRWGFVRNPSPGTCPEITGWREAKQK